MKPAENWCGHCRAPYISMDPTMRCCATGRVDCAEFIEASWARYQREREFLCRYPGCIARATHTAADDSAEWTHVCSNHLGFSYRPDAWLPIRNVACGI